MTKHRDDTRIKRRLLFDEISQGALGVLSLFVFFFTDTATTEIYTLSLHDALPISLEHGHDPAELLPVGVLESVEHLARSEEHTSELQSHVNLVCRLLLEKKKK